jgi:F-type H+-transporting ATPase subunit epsilon
MGLFTLKIITPEGKFFEKQCRQVNVPGLNGRLGILARHVDFVSILKPGPVDVFLEDSNVTRIIISSGVLEMRDNNCILLVENGSTLEDLDIDAVKQKLEKTKIKLQKTTTPRLKAFLETYMEYLEELLKCLEYDKADV